MEDRTGSLERTAEIFDIPGQAVGLPRVELIGRHEARVENHRGILAYDAGEILVSGGKIVIRIRGRELRLGAMSARELIITGTVASVELE